MNNALMWGPSDRKSAPGRERSAHSCRAVLLSLIVLMSPPVSTVCARDARRFQANALNEDWSFLKDRSLKTDFWDPIKYIRHGSVGVSIYDAGITDGMNEKGLVGNTLYLVESDYGDPAKTSKPTISIGAWLPYVLDNFTTVKETVEFLAKDPFVIVAPILLNGRPAVQHFSLSDSTGDSAIIEYLGGKPVIHHGPQYQVLTNSPTYDQQLALNAYWDQIGGSKFLPGTINAADRFVRLSYNLESSPKYKDPRETVASVFSQIRAIGVPLGMEDPDRPNISMTLWRSVADHGAKVYYFGSAWLPTESCSSRPTTATAGSESIGTRSNALRPGNSFRSNSPMGNT